MNACPIIDRLTRPILPSGVPNGEDSKLCAADGWIVEGWGHVNRYTFEAKSPAVFTWSSIIVRFFAVFRLDCSVPCRSLRRGPPRTKFFLRTNKS